MRKTAPLSWWTVCAQGRNSLPPRLMERSIIGAGSFGHSTISP